jgi:hypothetical protein
MSIISDTYAVDTSEQGFVRIDYSSQRTTAAGPHGLKATLWFERPNLGWLIEALEACVTVDGLPERSTTSGQDVLRVYESGPEPAPYINLENERAEGAPHGGLQWFAMSKPLTVKLISELSELRAQALVDIDQWQKGVYDEATEHAELMKNVKPSSLVEPPPPKTSKSGD